MATQTGLTSAALTVNTFTRAGFTFAGWNTDPNGNGVSYADDATYPFTANTVLYAQWTQNATTTVAPVVTPTSTTATDVAATDRSSDESSDVLPVSGDDYNELLGWTMVLLILGTGLLLGRARRHTGF